MPFTYEPKIPAVLDGRCSQSIRAGSKFNVGDSILMYSWKGTPYSKGASWTNRMSVEVIQVIPIIVSEAGVKFPKSYGDKIVPWTHEWINGLAEMDFIDPPTGEALRDELLDYLNLPEGEEADCQIIRWS